jgi:hypothetical protein
MPSTVSSVLVLGALIMLQQLLQLLCWREAVIPVEPIKHPGVSYVLLAAATTAAAVLLP